MITIWIKRLFVLEFFNSLTCTSIGSKYRCNVWSVWACMDTICDKNNCHVANYPKFKLLFAGKETLRRLRKPGKLGVLGAWWDHWAHNGICHISWWPDFSPQNQYGGRRKPTPISCLLTLTSTYVLWHVCTSINTHTEARTHSHMLAVVVWM